MKLEWHDKNKGKHHLYRTHGNIFAVVPVLEHSVGPAGFEVYKDNVAWCCWFWHGNRGYSIVERAFSQELAKEAAQERMDQLTNALI